MMGSSPTEVPKISSKFSRSGSLTDSLLSDTLLVSVPRVQGPGGTFSQPSPLLPDCHSVLVISNPLCSSPGKDVVFVDAK